MGMECKFCRFARKREPGAWMSGWSTLFVAVRRSSRVELKMEHRHSLCKWRKRTKGKNDRMHCLNKGKSFGAKFVSEQKRFSAL